MAPLRFPLYRRLGADLSWYRVESETAFTEVQRVGSRYISHIVASGTYPDRLRVAELIAATDGPWVVISADEFDELLLRSQE